MKKKRSQKSKIFNSVNLILAVLLVAELIVITNPSSFTGQPVRTLEKTTIIEDNNLNKIISNSQNKYSLELDIPSYLDQSLSHPKKFFSGRKIRIVQESIIKDYPDNVKLFKRLPIYLGFFLYIWLFRLDGRFKPPNAYKICKEVNKHMEEIMLEEKLEHIEKDIQELKNLLKHSDKKPAKLAGVLKGIEITEEDIAEAKKSLFPSVDLGYT